VPAGGARRRWTAPRGSHRAFTLLDFPPSNRSAGGDTAVVYAEGLTGELYLDKPHEVQRYREAHAAILACALDEAATQDMLLAAAKDLER